MDVCIAENRSQRIEKSFAAERKIVWRRMYGRFCILLGNSFRYRILWVALLIYSLFVFVALVLFNLNFFMD